MKKILLPSIDYPPARGGVARYIQAILTTYPNQVKLLPLKPLSTTAAVMRLAFESRAYDEIWTHHILPLGTAAMLLQRLTGKPYVVFLHGLDFDLARRSAWKRRLARMILQRAARVVVNSQALGAEVREFVDLERSPLVVYPMLSDELIAAAADSSRPAEPINLQKLGELALGLSRAATPMFVPRRNEKADQPLRLLTVARVVERKGHLKVIRALLDIPDAVYTIVGDGPQRAAVVKLVASLGLEQRVTFVTDATDADLPALYRAADIFVMPTHKTALDREGFGIVYLEAQLFGLPVIATRYPGVDEAVHDGVGGLLIGEDTEDVIAAIRRLKDTKLRQQLGARGRTFATREFTREQQMYKLLELL